MNKLRPTLDSLGPANEKKTKKMNRPVLHTTEIPRMAPPTREEISARVAAQFATESQRSPAEPPNALAARALASVMQHLKEEECITAELAGVGVDEDIVRALLESAGNVLTTDLLSELKEMIAAPTQVVGLNAYEQPLGPTHVGDVLLLRPAGEEIQQVAVEAPDGTRRAILACLDLQTFGVWRVGTLPALLASSSVFDCTLALEGMYDRLFWTWDPSWWGEELESALCTLLVAIEEDLHAFLGSMAPMLRAFDSGGGELAQMQAMYEMASSDAAKALASRDGAAIGRLHQTLYQFLDFGEMRAMLPPSFMSAIERFDRLRCEKLLGGGQLRPQLEALAQAIPRYVATMQQQLAHPTRGSLARLELLAQKLGSHLGDEATQLESSCLWGLFGGVLEAKPALLVPGAGSVGSGGHALALQHLPVIPLEAVAAGGEALLDAHVVAFNECLVRDACCLGSPLMGYSLAPDGASEERIDSDACMLTRLLHAGFGYVTQGVRCLPILPVRRAVLQLGAGTPRPRKLAARRKDVTRMLRNAPPPHPFVLRINTDFALACTQLQIHHEHSWVSPALLRVWHRMMAASHRSLIVFELWCGDAMVAADFGHPVGASFYVATRWHDATLSKYQPGFVLALASANVLAANGFELWDLGGTDSSAGMRYKESLAHVVTRPYFHDLFRRARATDAPALQPGVACGATGVTEADLF